MRVRPERFPWTIMRSQSARLTGLGRSGGEGRQEHGLFESLVARVRGVLISDRGFRLSGDRRESGVGGLVHSGVGSASERLGDEGGGGGPGPDAGHGGQNLVMRVGLHQGLDLGGGVGPLGVQGDEVARQMGQHHASDVGAGDTNKVTGSLTVTCAGGVMVKQPTLESRRDRAPSAQVVHTNCELHASLSEKRVTDRRENARVRALAV